jgi:hypothetical protein
MPMQARVAVIDHIKVLKIDEAMRNEPFHGRCRTTSTDVMPEMNRPATLGGTAQELPRGHGVVEASKANDRPVIKLVGTNTTARVESE